MGADIRRSLVRFLRAFATNWSDAIDPTANVLLQIASLNMQAN